MLPILDGRKEVWDEVFSFIVEELDSLWMVGGDFNSPLFPSEKMAGGGGDYGLL